MMEITFIITLIIALIVLAISSYTDIKTREVPDWVNFGLIGVGIGLNLIYSLVYSNYYFIIYSITGLIFMVIIGYTMFYTGQWGGGDSKILMGLGALFGIKFDEWPFLGSLIINIFIIGAVYGTIWSLVLAIKNRKNFFKELNILFSKIKNARKYILIIAFILILIALFLKDQLLKLSLMFLALAIVTMFYLWLVIKAVEKSSMIVYTSPDKLTEGDWIVKDIYVEGKRITGPKDLGIEKKQIKQLIKFFKQKKINKIPVKQGIPFVPSFLIGYILSLLLLMFYSPTKGFLLFLFI